MVEYILGNYLVELGKLTKEDLKRVIEKQDEVRVKMGLLAVSEGMMTAEQAENVNKLQTTMDKRFGDIAVEKGYLTEEQISNLLKKQGNAYLAFAQALVNENLLQLSELEEIIEGFRTKYSFSKSDMEDLRSDEPERIVPLFLPPEMMCYKDIIGVMVRTLIRCVNRHIYVGKACVKDTYSTDYAVLQKTTGYAVPVFGYKELEIGISEVNGGMSAISTAFFKEETALDESDVLDAAGELINCISGLYSSSLSRKGVETELLPPINITQMTTLNELQICCIPVYFDDKEARFMVMGRK